MLWAGHHFKVTDQDIEPTGKIEVWEAETRDEALSAALYSHRLHSGRATISPRGVIYCPGCDVHIAITKGDRTW